MSFIDLHNQDLRTKGEKEQDLPKKEKKNTDRQSRGGATLFFFLGLLYFLSDDGREVINVGQLHHGGREGHEKEEEENENGNQKQS